MADFSATVLQELRAKVTEKNSKEFEMRKSFGDALTPFMEDASITMPDHAAIKTNLVQTEKSLYIKNKDFTISTSGKSCTPSGEECDSATVSLTWHPMTAVIRMSEKKFKNNEYGRMDAYAAALFNMEKSMFYGTTGLEKAMLTYLNTNRTYVNALSAGSGHNTWIGAPSYIVNVLNADIARFYDYAKPEMQLNNYDGDIIDIHSTMWNAELAHYAAQGTANSTNTSYQFDGFSKYATNNLALSSYYKHIHYLIPRGGVSLLTWDGENRRLPHYNVQKGTNIWTSYDSLFKPGITMDLFIYETCGNTTDEGGSKQDLITNMEFTLWYAILKAPISVSDETPIFKYGIL